MPLSFRFYSWARDRYVGNFGPLPNFLRGMVHRRLSRHFRETAFLLSMECLEDDAKKMHELADKYQSAPYRTGSFQ
jgi:hypothetical protein